MILKKNLYKDLEVMVQPLLRTMILRNSLGKDYKVLKYLKAELEYCKD